jgi:hypothetical protein
MNADIRGEFAAMIREAMKEPFAELMERVSDLESFSDRSVDNSSAAAFSRN